MVQMPIFIALYALIYQVIDLRGAQFLWIKDLSQPDRLFVFKSALPLIGTSINLLPILNAVIQMFASKFSAQPSTDAQQQQMQKTMVYIMPVMMLFFFYSIPSGVVLYWLVSTLWQVLQQLWVNKHMPKPAPLPAVAAGRSKT